MSIKKELEKSIPSSVKLTEEEKVTIRNRVHQPYSSKMQFKPIIVSILFVMILTVLILPAIKPVDKTENALNETTLKHSIVSPAPVTEEQTIITPIPITEEQKHQYYEQYLKIVERVMEQKIGLSLAVPAMDEFKQSDWVVPKEYEKMVQDWVESFLATERETLAAVSTDLKPAVTNLNGDKTQATYLYFSDIVRKIEVTGSFETQYSVDHDRQLFGSVDNISSELTSSMGTWEQTSYKASLIDGGRKYSIRIEGIFDYNNISIEKVFTIEFNCDENGRIY